MKAVVSVLALCLVVAVSGCEVDSGYEQTRDYAARAKQKTLLRVKQQRQHLRAVLRKQRQAAARKAAAAAAEAQAVAESYAAPPDPSTPDCDPNYSGACLNANSPDYDCAGGSGDGPDYTGYVQVVGTDIHGLDSDSDGIGCE